MSDPAAPKHENLAAALVAAQAELPAVEPNAVNPHFHSKFVSLDHLIARTRPVLNRHGLAIRQAPAIHDGGGPCLETTIHHVSGEYVTTVMPLILAKQDMQGLGAAITYARRYAWASALGISSDEDDDGESNTVDTPQGRAVQQAAKPTQAAKPANPPAGAAAHTAKPRPLNERKQKDINEAAARLEDAGAVSREQFLHVLATEYGGVGDVSALSADQGEKLLERLRKKESELPK